MMSLLNAFPQTAALQPDLPIWGMSFQWESHDQGLLQVLWKVQEASVGDPARLWSWTEAMVADMATQRAAATTEAVTDTIDCARFITCIPALHATRSAGQIGPCYDWIWTAISPTHLRSQRVNKNVFSFCDFPNAPENLFRLYLQRVPDFAASAFYVAYKLGGLDALASAVGNACWTVCSQMHHLDNDNEVALDAMIQMTIWAAHCERPEGEAWAAELAGKIESVRSPVHRKQIAMTFLTPANRYVAGSPQDWAEQILSEHDASLVEHERLQVLAVSLSRPENWFARRSTILAEIMRLRVLCLTHTRPGESDLEVLEQRVSVLHPLIFSLVNWGELHDLVDVLGAWYRAPGAEPADADILAVVPTHNGGAAYLWPQGRFLTGTASYQTHDALQRASSKVLGTYVRGTDGDHAPEVYEGFRFDVVAPEASRLLEDKMKAHYSFETLAERLPTGWTPRSVVVFPAGPEPVQAMLGKTTGIEAPLEISFEQAQTPRPIRRVSVWAGGLLHEEFELAAIRHIASSVGWTLAVSCPKAPSVTDLRAFYEDPKSDLLWVISHGAHDPFSVTGTGLHLQDESLVTLGEARAWCIPAAGRRLLVLNSCSGAAAQGRGGLARIGLGQNLVSGRQAVIGHLWPIHWSAGLAFGAALAACLGSDPTEDAMFAATRLMREPEQLATFMEDKFAGCGELLDRLRRSSEDLGSLTAWGCPVLLT